MSAHTEAGLSEARHDGGRAEMIRFEGVSKRFGETVVLRDLNLSIGTSEIVSIIGPSGSGKTTVLRLVMALETIDEGRIYLGGECLSHRQRNGRWVPADE